MRFTSSDIQAVLHLIKRLIMGCWVGGKYIVVGHTGATQLTSEVSTGKAIKASTATQCRVRQHPPVIIEQGVYEIPAMVRLKKVNLDTWQEANLQRSDLDEAIKQHFDYMTANGLKPGKLYFDV